MDVAATAPVETRRLRRVNGRANVNERRTRKMCAIELEGERPTRKMYALEVNKLVAEERRRALRQRARHLSCDYQFAPLPRPSWMRQRRSRILGVIAAAISGLLVYLVLH